MERRICIEACITTVQGAIAAYEGGADRLELNSALSLDGLTPSLGLLKEVKKAVPLPVIVMIRPRPNGFFYSASEFAVMQADIEVFLNEGVAGFAFGLLTPDYEIDLPRSRIIVQQLSGAEAVFHRAFDITPEAPQALEILIELGIDRILTSGHSPTALQGIDNLANLYKMARNRIEILPGSGIKPENASTILTHTGCTQIHGTFRAPFPSSNVSGLEALRTHPRPGTDKKIVEQIRTIVDAL